MRFLRVTDLNSHGLWKEDESGKSYYAYGGDFNEVVHDGTFVMVSERNVCLALHSLTITGWPLLQ